MEQRWDRNLALSTDSYKFSQWAQLPDGTTYCSSQVIPRGGPSPVIVVFGHYGHIKEHLGRRITMEQVEYAKARVDKHMGPNVFHYEGWKAVVTKMNGVIPLRIKAVKEGTVMPVNMPTMVLESTRDEFAWIVDHFETLMLHIWAPCTVATVSFLAKHIIRKYLQETGDEAGLPFKLHDFGYRGVSSSESAAVTGAAHLVNFLGSDTFIANEYLTEFYKADMASFSIPATQHSTMTILGPEGEYKQILHFLNRFSAAAIKACVLDSYNIRNAIKFIGTQKELLEQQKTMFVARPDSGDPIEMSLECIEGLNESFGHTVNAKGYKVLNTVRVIYGDGIDGVHMIALILENLKKHKWSADNIAFGMGGGLLQKNNRDTFKWAIKSWAAIVDGVFRKVFKDPITDPGKRSLAGLHNLVMENNVHVVKPITKEEWDANPESEYVLIYEDGQFFNEPSLDEIRARAEEGYERYKHLL